jgi:hypothetical protein
MRTKVKKLIYHKFESNDEIKNQSRKKKDQS